MKNTADNFNTDYLREIAAIDPEIAKTIHDEIQIVIVSAVYYCFGV